MSERENLGAGIYAALSALVVLLCLIGAFVLPPSMLGGKWLGIIALISYFVGIPILLRMAHRSRIREAVAQIGGSVVIIKRRSFRRQPYAFSRYAFFRPVRYRVEYTDLLGATHDALCNSGLFQGVEWLEDVVVETP